MTVVLLTFKVLPVSLFSLPSVRKNVVKSISNSGAKSKGTALPVGSPQKPVSVIVLPRRTSIGMS